MKPFRSLVAAQVLIFAASTAAWAGQAPQPAVPAPQTPPPAQQQPPPPPPPPPPAKEIKYEETVVVTASKTEQKIVDAPVTMSVFTPKFLANSPANNYGDLLRGVPGVNVTQLSARDINITSRGASSSLSTSQLAVLDGRSLYQDFFGFIMWDFMPSNLNEIKQIEIIRGPASAVWGANALTGVVNIITKSPRENPGTSVTMGYGQFNRDVSGTKNKEGGLFYLNGTYSGIANDQWSYKLTGGMYTSEALARPTGLIPNGGTTSYPAFTNEGTSQPKFDIRVDRDFTDGAKKLTFSGGSAGTAGIMESGIGPFKIQNGTRMSYGKVGYTNKAFHVQAFMNALDGKAPNLLSTDAAGVPIQLNFSTKTFDVEAGDSRAAGRNVFTYGGNLRANKFNLTIAPAETSRKEGGVYLQDEIFLNDHFRLVAGARVDKFSSIDKAVFSPRVALLIKPKSNHTFRLTYNRAFRAPSMINNNLDVTIATPLPLIAVNAALKANLFPATASFLVPTRATGNPNLTEEHLDAYEASYSGRIGQRTVVSAAFYLNEQKNQIFFTVKENYSLTAPPTGWTSMPQWAAFGPAATFVATQVWGGVQTSANFPKEYNYQNLGTVKNKGIELGLDSGVGPHTTFYVNYSYQWQPEPSFPDLTATQALAEINLPAKSRFNAGLTTTVGRVFGTISASYSDKAFWQDVLDSRFHGTTSAYTLTNLSIGTKWNHDMYTVIFRVNNVFNEQVQQHIFGDVIKRQLVGEFRVNLPK